MIRGNIRKNSQLRNAFLQTTAIVVLILLLITRQILFTNIMDKEKASDNMIEISVRQSALCEKIMLYSHLLSSGEDSAGVGTYLAQLKASAAQFEKERTELVEKNGIKTATMHLDTVLESHTAITSAAKQIILLSKQEPVDRSAIYENFLIIEKNETAFLSGMDSVSKNFINDNTSDIQFLSFVFNMLLLVFLIIVIVLLIFVLLPRQKRMEEAYQNIVNIGYKDKLTDIYNRYYFDDIIEEAIRQSERKHNSLSMILFDLDYFKQVNDNWGHPTGDEVLKACASLASSKLRSTDIFARYGGEEFLLLLPDTGLAKAAAIAEEIRRTFEQFQHPVAGKITASFGVAERREQENFGKWYKRVDIALYRAKEEGRNRVVSFDNMKSAVHLYWTPDMECGQEEIDSQHKELFDLGNHLLYVTVSENKPEILMPLLELMLDRLAFHFHSEEEIIQKAGYPDYKNQSELHEHLLTKAEQLKSDLVDGLVKPSVFISFLIDDVIVGHMIEEDKKFFPYMQK